MLDKLILVFYINVGNIQPGEVGSYIEEVSRESLAREEDEKQMIKYFIPVRGEESKVVCLNPPVYVNNFDTYSNVLKQINEIDSRLDKFT